MPTPFLSDSLVKLPRFTLHDLNALMLQIEAEAGAIVEERKEAGKELPEFVRKALARVSQTRAELERALHMHRLSREPSALQRQSDRKMDDAWRAFEAFLKAWCLLDDGGSPGQAEAQKAYDLVIGDGMDFLTLPFELEWQETQKRLEILESQKLARPLEEMGGARFLAHLKQAFREYGEALYITSPQPAEKPAVRPLWDAAHGAVRHYFAKVVAMEDPDEPESQLLVRRLLRPILEWRLKASAPSRAMPAVAVTQSTPEGEPIEQAKTQSMKAIRK